MKAILVHTLEEFEAGGPGTIMFTADRTAILNKCPGCGRDGTLRIRDESKPVNHPSWLLSGDDDHVTLKPSVHHPTSCGWHGYLTNGEWHT